jgi:hypothetical protein
MWWNVPFFADFTVDSAAEMPVRAHEQAVVKRLAFASDFFFIVHYSPFTQQYHLE